MKTRYGFVSNSSTSSFCIYGKMIDKTAEDLVSMSELRKVITNKKYNLETHSGECEDYYVGRSWCNVKDEETGKQFKESVEKEVKELFKSLKMKCDDSFGTYEEAFYNG